MLALPLPLPLPLPLLVPLLVPLPLPLLVWLAGRVRLAVQACGAPPGGRSGRRFPDTTWS